MKKTTLDINKIFEASQNEIEELIAELKFIAHERVSSISEEQLDMHYPEADKDRAFDIIVKKFDLDKESATAEKALDLYCFTEWWTTDYTSDEMCDFEYEILCLK